MTANPVDGIAAIRARLGDESADPLTGVSADDRYHIDDADADALLRASDRIRILGPSKYSAHQHEFVLRRATVLARDCGGLADALENRDAAERLVAWINTEKTGSPETNKDYRVALRQFGKLATGGRDIPESLAWVPGGYPDNYDPAPDPSDMLHWDDDIQPMIRAAHNHRDKALVAMAWDLGARPGELFDLAVGALTDHKHGLQVTVAGKRGRRSPVIIPSVPYVRQWLQVHPGDDRSPLWSGLNSAEGISNNRIRDILGILAARAGISKPITPTNFRKSSASYLASQNVSQAHLENHHGWSRGSDIAARYISVFAEANDREIARAHGRDVSEDEVDPIAPLTCPRCQRDTPREEDLCVWCGQALSQTAAEAADAQERRFFDSAAEADGDLLDDVAEARAHLEENPALRRLLLDE